MMNFVFAESVLMRMPAFKISDYVLPPQEHLKSPLLRSALWLTSPVFYELLQRKNFDYSLLNLKESHTLSKYLNRMCFRPTPFGLFATVSVLTWSIREHFDHHAPLLAAISLSQEWSVAHESNSNFNAGAEQFTGNPLVYRQLDEYRFIRTDIVDGKREYLLQSISCSPVLQAVFSALLCKPTGKHLQQVIEQKAGCTPAEADDFLAFLISAQLVLRAGRPGITGTWIVPDVLASMPIVGKIRLPVSGLQPAVLIQAGLHLNEALPQAHRIQMPLNTIFIRKGGRETLPQEWQKQISDGLQAVAALTPAGEVAAMAKFISAFRTRYEDEEVPLLKALDPETGIAYGPSGIEPEQHLVETINVRDRSAPAQGSPWTPAHTFLLEQWQSAIRLGSQVIDLDPEGILRLGTGKAEQPILGLSVLFRKAGQDLWLESAGGVNTPALAGRFTAADPEIHLAARAMAVHTEALYPDYIFAELLHLTDPHTDNVNVRECLWSHELSITSPSSLSEAQQVHLSDLTLRLSGSRILLWSVSRGKVVIPRLSSAYNHHLNKLPLFRFLADLPYQYVRSKFSFELRSFFPELRFYPRVSFKNTILQPATWILNQDDVKELTRGPEVEAGERLRTLARRLSLPEVFYTGNGDRQMVVMSQSNQEAAFFSSLIRNQTEVIIREAPDLAAYDKGSSTDNPLEHVQQFNAFILPNDPGALPVASPAQVSKPLPRRFLPGSEWLYLKIAVPRSMANKLLLRIRPLIYRRYTAGSVKQWFFVRYEDSAPHLRLRLLADPEAIPQLLQAFRKKLQHDVFENVIREYQVDTYAREIERYAAGGMSATEHFFWKSSEITLCFVRMQAAGSSMLPYQFAMITAGLIVDILLQEPEGLVEFYRQSYRLFLPEFEEPALQKNLDRRYRQLQTDLTGQFDFTYLENVPPLRRLLQQFSRSLRAIDLSSAGPDQKYGYIRSLVHLHVNRLFTSQARLQEMIIYYFLYKQARSAAARVR